MLEHQMRELLQRDPATFWSLYAQVYSAVLKDFSAHRSLREDAARALEGYVLDLGCGPGLASESLLEQGCRVEGMDFNIDMVRAALSQVPGARFTQGDAHNLPYEHETFDGVMALNVLYYVEEPDQVLEQVHRVLKPEGVFVVSGPHQQCDIAVLNEQLLQETRRTDLHSFFAINAALNEKGLRNLYTLDEVKRLLEGAQFTVEQVRAAYLGQNYFAVGRK